MINTMRVNKNSLRSIVLSCDIRLPVGSKFMVNRIVIEICRNSQESITQKCKNCLNKFCVYSIDHIKLCNIKCGKLCKLRRLPKVVYIVLKVPTIWWQTDYKSLQLLSINDTHVIIHLQITLKAYSKDLFTLYSMTNPKKIYSLVIRN